MSTETVISYAPEDGLDTEFRAPETTGDRFRSMKRQACRRADRELTHAEFLDQLLDVYALHLDEEFDVFAGDRNEH